MTISPPNRGNALADAGEPATATRRAGAGRPRSALLTAPARARRACPEPPPLFAECSSRFTIGRGSAEARPVDAAADPDAGAADPDAGAAEPDVGAAEPDTGAPLRGLWELVGAPVRGPVADGMSWQYWLAALAVEFAHGPPGWLDAAEASGTLNVRSSAPTASRQAARCLPLGTMACHGCYAN